MVLIMLSLSSAGGHCLKLIEKAVSPSFPSERWLHSEHAIAGLSAAAAEIPRTRGQGGEDCAALSSVHGELEPRHTGL